MVSFGTGRCAKGAPGVYTRVASYRQWIEDNLVWILFYLQGVPKKVWITATVQVVIHTFFGTPCIWSIKKHNQSSIVAEKILHGLITILHFYRFILKYSTMKIMTILFSQWDVVDHNIIFFETHIIEVQGVPKKLPLSSFLSFWAWEGCF